MRIGSGRLDDPIQDSEHLIVKDIMNREQKVLDENVEDTTVQVGQRGC